MWAERVEGESKQTCVNADVGRGWPSGGVRARLRLSRARGLPWAVTLPPAQRTQRREVTGKGPWALEVLPESPGTLRNFPLGTFAALSKNPVLVPSTCMATQLPTVPIAGDLMPSSGLHGNQAHRWCSDMCRHNITHNTK